MDLLPFQSTTLLTSVLVFSLLLLLLQSPGLLMIVSIIAIEEPFKSSNNTGIEMSSAVTTRASVTAGDNNAKSRQSVTAGLVEVKLDDDEESLPDGWKKMKNVQNNEIFYLNEKEMITQRHRPGTDAPEDDGYGMGW